MTVLITLTAAGIDSGPFDLYSNFDGYITAFETGVSKASLLGGYTSAVVPDYTTVVRVKSEGNCVNYIDIVLQGLTTTTTTTIAPTTTTTTTVAPTTTTTTTASPTTTTTTTIAFATWDVSTLSNASAVTACTYAVDQNLYAAAIPAGVANIAILYTDSALTTPYVGNGLFYRIREGGNFFSMNIDASGNVTNIIAC